jgi:hypothetical protein
MNERKVTTVCLAVGSVLHRIVDYLKGDSRFSQLPGEVRCDCKEPMRDKVAGLVARDLRKAMGRRSTLTLEAQTRFGNDVERCKERHKQSKKPITDQGAVALVACRWKRGDGSDLPFDTAMRYYKEHKKRKREQRS